MEKLKMAVPDESITPEHLELARTAIILAATRWEAGGEKGDVMNFVCLEVARVIATICEAVNVEFKGTMVMPGPSEN